jgi:serine protease Do
MRAVNRSLVFIGLLAWAIAGLAVALFLVEEATHKSPRALAAPPPVVQAGQPQAAQASAGAPAPLAGARALSGAFTHVAAGLKPAVVRITTEKSMGGRQRGPAIRRHFRIGPGGGGPFGGGSPFGPFGMSPDMPNPFDFGFGDPDDQGGPPMQPMPMPRQTGLGSGVIIDPQGYVLTNNHVVDGADKIRVNLADGRVLTAKAVGTDPKTDVALLKVEGAGALPYAKLGNSDALQVGEFVMAIGNPYGLDATVTVGVVSAKGRDHLEGGPAYEDFIQTDANINPGNSGGPLVNLEGEIVGINTAIKVSQLGNTGIGFAIPSNMARSVADQLRSQGRVRRAWLGVNIQNVTPDLARGLGQGAPGKGALVAQITPGSPAEKAGLQPGDIVTALDGIAVATSKDLQRMVLERRIGQRVQLTVWRQGREMSVAATTGELPDDGTGARGRGGPTDGNAPSSFGLELRDFTPDLAQRLGLPGGKGGAAIAQVTPGSPAEDAGLAQGDVIIEIDRRPVRSAAEAAQVLKAPRPEGHVLRVRRGDAILFVPLRK